MPFGAPFAQKPRKAEPVRPFTVALARIVVLAILASAGAAYGIYLYYTHAFRPPKPAPSTSAPTEIPAPDLIPIDLDAG